MGALNQKAILGLGAEPPALVRSGARQEDAASISCEVALAGFEFHERTITAVREGRYNLLLGAGASRGATSANGASLPDGDEYGRDIKPSRRHRFLAGESATMSGPTSSCPSGRRSAVRVNSSCSPRRGGVFG
jgi:hypothetical protein